MAMGWHVTSQRQESRLLPGGAGFTQVWVVGYSTDPEGVNGTVEIDERLYTEDYVRGRIDEIVAQNKAIHNL